MIPNVPLSQAQASWLPLGPSAQPPTHSCLLSRPARAASGTIGGSKTLYFTDRQLNLLLLLGSPAQPDIGKAFSEHRWLCPTSPTLISPSEGSGPLCWKRFPGDLPGSWH